MFVEVEFYLPFAKQILGLNSDIFILCIFLNSLLAIRITLDSIS
jgi:hypothetical protein